MVQCAKIRVKHRALCAGDLDRKIEIQNRTLDATRVGSTDYTHTFTATKSVWSALKTTKGKDIFFATNLDQAVTHIFYVRFLSWLTADNWVKFKSQNFDILEVEDLDERGEWQAIYCNVRGSSAEAMNYA